MTGIHLPLILVCHTWLRLRWVWCQRWLILSHLLPQHYLCANCSSGDKKKEPFLSLQKPHISCVIHIGSLHFSIVQFVFGFFPCTLWFRPLQHLWIAQTSQLFISLGLWCLSTYTQCFLLLVTVDAVRPQLRCHYCASICPSSNPRPGQCRHLFKALSGPWPWIPRTSSATHGV